MRKITILLAMALIVTTLLVVIAFNASAAEATDLYLEEYGVTVPSSVTNNFVFIGQKPGESTWTLITDDSGNVVTRGTAFGDGAVASGKNYLVSGHADGIYAGGTVVIYMLKDTTMTGNASNRLLQISGTLRVDLGGHTLNAGTKPRLLGFQSNSSDIIGNNNPAYTSRLEMVNGTVKMQNPVIEIYPVLRPLREKRMWSSHLTALRLPRMHQQHQP